MTREELHILHRIDRGINACMSELSYQLARQQHPLADDNTTLTGVLAELEARGLIATESVVHVRLTDRGRAELREARRAA